MFDHLPLHIRETIFSRVSYVDLFETARVSQEWWALSVASFERVLHAKDDFLVDQVDFCNEMMPKEEQWEWWMLMEFTKSKRFHLNQDDYDTIFTGADGRLIKYFKDREINVQDLTIGIKASFYEDYLMLPQDFTQLFPDLISLALNGIEFENCSAVLLPSNLKVLKLNSVRIPKRTNLSSMLLDPSELKLLQITGFACDVYFDGRNCQNLTSLSIDVSHLGTSAGSEFRILKRILDNNKRLKSVSLKSAKITKEWLKMFPANVVNLELEHPYLCLDLIEVFGDSVLYERKLLFYIFEDWQSVVEFRTSGMKWDKNWVEDVDVWDEDDDYEIRYVCRPTAAIEEIEVRRESTLIALNDLILQDNQGLELTALKYQGIHLPLAVPPTVQNLNLHCLPRAVSDTLVLQDPSVLETLDLNQHHASVIDINDMSNMTNLKKLYLSECDSRQLASFLASCTSLHELRLASSEFNLFKDLPANIKSVSLKHLTIVAGDDIFEDIMRHLPSLQTLFLEDHFESAIVKSDVNAINHLQYFKAFVMKDQNVAFQLSSLEFPYMVFASSDRHNFYAASKGVELMNEIAVNASKNNNVNAGRYFFLNTSKYSTYVKREKLSLIYSKNVSTRVLKNSCPEVKTVHDLITKPLSLNFA